MAYASFRQFIDELDKAGELTRISAPVETDLLISEWANREMKSPGGGKALLFENPTIFVPARRQYDGITPSHGTRVAGQQRGRPRPGDPTHPQGKTAD
jgi:UbiD family decarboxylase